MRRWRAAVAPGPGTCDTKLGRNTGPGPELGPLSWDPLMIWDLWDLDLSLDLDVTITERGEEMIKEEHSEEETTR